MSLYDVNTKQFVFAYLKECVSQYYIYTYIDICFFFFFKSLVLTIRFGLASLRFAWY